ncbi:MAG TPA: ABC transporter ATP-binding protein, partial [Rhizomicrobium sp.]|nr:ABC transporter ATP-binding protein [Rhizomicrobium sp.]
LTLKGVTRRLGKFVLGPLNLEVPRGSVTALIGPNGAGKTTTLDLALGLGAPDGGRIEVVGLGMPADEVAIKQKVAYVNPDLNYQPWGRVGRALNFLRKFYPDWNDARCEQLLADFGLERGQKIATLSFGARIKLSLVAAFSRDADLLLLDEPTTGLDVNAKLKLFGLILDFVKREDRAVVISSHQLADLERVADQVAIIDKGRLLIFERMDRLVSRFIQLDVRLTTGGAMPALDGVRALARDGERLRLLLDLDIAAREQLAAHGLVVLSETPLTLEEIFLGLVAPEVA